MARRLYALAQACVQHRKMALTLWLALLVGMGVLGTAFKGTLSDELTIPGIEAQEAQDLLADYQRKQRAADEEAKAIIEQARREAETMKAESAKSLREQLERRTRLAEEKIARAEAQAVSEVRAAAVDVATSAAERIIGDKLKGDGGADLVNRSIRDLKAKLN